MWYVLYMLCKLPFPVRAIGGSNSNAQVCNQLPVHCHCNVANGATQGERRRRSAPCPVCHSMPGSILQPYNGRGGQKDQKMLMSPSLSSCPKSALAPPPIHNGKAATGSRWIRW